MGFLLADQGYQDTYLALSITFEIDERTCLGQSDIKLFFGQLECVLKLEGQLLDGDEVVVCLDGLLNFKQKLNGGRVVAFR